MPSSDASDADTAVLPPGTAPSSTRQTTAADPNRIGRYTLLGRIGAGGMGIVYAARDEELDRKLAIKLLRTDDSPDGPARLKREAQALAKLSHPHVVQVYEVGQHERQVYLAMELVQGRTLRSWQLGDHHWRDVVAMYIAAGRGLAAAHAAGIVHRDFKPDTVLVGADGRPRVLDFGLARPDASTGPTTAPQGEIAAHELTEAGTVLGTPAYMPPEQLQGLDVDARCDQFAFCVSLFEALHGQRPFAGRTFAELEAAVARGVTTTVDLSRRGIPRELHAAIARGLAADPDARHRDMPSLLSALEHATKRRRTAGRWIAGFAIAASLSATAIVLWPRDETTAPTDSVPAASDARASILAASDLPAELPTPVPHDPLGVTAHRLDNGLTVFVVPRRDQPMVHVSFAVRLGAYDEPPDKPGLHHMAAHMLGVGSLRLGSRDPDREAALLLRRDALLAELERSDDPRTRSKAIADIADIEHEASALVIADERLTVLREAGARAVRFRQSAGLVVSVDVPAPSLDLLLAVEADRLRNPSFRSYLAETNVLLAEARLVLDGTRSDDLRAWELLAPSIGSYATPVREAAYLSTLPFSAIEETIAQRVAPNNSAIVLVGDVEPDAARRAVEAAFGDWEPSALPPPASADVPVADGRVFETAVGVGGPRATIAFPLPPALREDRRAALLLADVLVQAVGDPDGPLPSVATLDAIVEGNVLAITTTANADAQLDDVEAEIAALLENAAAGRIEPGRIAQAIARRELRFARLSIDEDEIAAAIADAYVERRSWSATATELATPAVGDLAIAVAARALLDHGRAVVFRTDGRYEPPAIPRLPVPPGELPEGGRSAYATELLARPRSRIEPQFLLAGRHYTRDEAEGVAVVTTRTEGVLFRAGVRWPVGVAHDWWACYAISTALDDLEDRLQREGVDMDVDCDRSATTVRIEGPSARFDTAWSELLSRLRVTTLSDEAVRDYAQHVLARRHTARADPDRVFESLVARAAWEDGVEHALPTDEAVARVNPTMLAASLQSLLETSPAVFYAGPDPHALGDRLPPVGIREPPEARPWRARRPEQPLVLVVDMPRGANAALAVSIPALASASPHAIAPATIHGRLLQGRFAQRFGDAGRSDDVDPLAALGDASFVGHAFVERDRVTEAVQTALSLLQPPPPRDAITLAWRSVEESVRADRVPPHAIPETVLAWSHDDDPRMATWEHLGALDLATLERDVRAAAGVHPTIAIAVDLDARDLASLRELATVETIELDDLCF
jgi:serine/threonine protein kinase